MCSGNIIIVIIIIIVNICTRGAQSEMGRVIGQRLVKYGANTCGALFMLKQAPDTNRIPIGIVWFCRSFFFPTRRKCHYNRTLRAHIAPIHGYEIPNCRANTPEQTMSATRCRKSQCQHNFVRLCYTRNTWNIVDYIYIVCFIWDDINLCRLYFLCVFSLRLSCFCKISSSNDSSES